MICKKIYLSLWIHCIVQLEESPFILFNTGFEVKADEKDSFKEKKDNYYDDDYL